MDEDYFDFFLSFSGRDRELADRAYEVLANAKYKVCYQPVHFAIGHAFTDDMDRFLNSSRAVIALVTLNYFAGSIYTRGEFDAGFRDGKLHICRFNGARIPAYAGSIIHQDFLDELVSPQSVDTLLRVARSQPTSAPSVARRIELDKNLPSWKGRGRGDELIGREKELQQLTDAFHDKNCSIAFVVAQGGYGKSALVRRWIEQIAHDSYLNIEAGFAYSFYKQGWEAGSSTEVSSSEFFSSCLSALAGVNKSEVEKKGTAKQWMEEILFLVRARRCLLVLDGLEPNQYPAGTSEEGGIGDPVLKEFIQQIKMVAGGLCIITSRIEAPELKGPFTASGRVKLIKVKALEGQSRIDAFIAAGLSASNPDIGSWAEKSEGHPLLIALLAPAIQSAGYSPETFRIDRVISDGNRHDFPATIRKVVVSHLELLGGDFKQRESGREKGGHPPKAILYSAALFDREIGYKELKEQLLDRARLPLFTAPLWGRSRWVFAKRYSENLFQQGLERLEKAAMLTKKGDPLDPDSWVLEAHPLVQAGVRAELIENYKQLWRKANWAVYRSLTKSVPRKPTTKEGLLTLYSAVPHGVNAGRGKDAGWMYARRCLHGFRAYSTNQHGMIGEDVALISHYFDGNWQNIKEDVGLNSYAEVQAWVWAGALLAGMNRGEEGRRLMKRGLEKAREVRTYTTAARTARVLGMMLAMAGDLPSAEHCLRSSIQDLEKRSPLWIRWVERSLVNVPFQRMASRAMLGSILHYQGRFAEAEAEFKDAELQQRKATRFKTLRGLWCCREIDMLLDLERFDEAERLIAAAMIEPEEPQGWGEGVFVLPILGLADVRSRIRRADYEGRLREPEALARLAAGLKDMEKGNTFRMDWLVPIAQIAAAGSHRLLGNPEAAEFPLHEAETQIERCENRLYRTDLYMEQTRFYLACGRREHAKASIQKAMAASKSINYCCRIVELNRLATLCGDA